MKSVFISTPQLNKSEAELRKEIIDRHQASELIVGEPLDLISTIISESDRKSNTSLTCLSKLVFLLSKADYVYFVSGWENDRECSLLHKCAVEYGLEILNA